MPVPKELLKLIAKGLDDLMMIVFDNGLACFEDLERLKKIVSEENLMQIEAGLTSLMRSENSPVFRAKAENVLTLIEAAIKRS